MKLLITTQTIDKNDPILGFFHGWVLEFAKHFEHIHVICLKEGEHSLPTNVSVYSLGKESGENRVKYILRFFRYAWKLRDEYDVVFSHMNPHYIVLAGLLWKVMGKRMFLWRNHAKMNAKTWIAGQFAEHVFYTSPFACTKRFAHSVQMPVGIDTNLFRYDERISRIEKSVLFLGRLSPVKRPDIFMKASALLSGFTISSYGDIPADSSIRRDELERLSLGKVKFYPAIPNYETPAIYNRFEIYVNLTPEGSMDKTILESAVCGALVLVCNKSFESLVPQDCLLESDAPQAVADAIQNLSSLSEEQKAIYRKQLIRMVEENHSLSKLVQKFVNIVHT